MFISENKKASKYFDKYFDESYGDTYNEAADLIYKALILSGYECYLVGGCVRDAILERNCHDIDLCTNATPNQIMGLVDEEALIGRTNMPGCEVDLSRLFIVATGLKHGTVTVVSKTDGSSVEITTYRVDGNSADHRHPDQVTFSASLEEDLKRRDFAINSLAFSYYKKHEEYEDFVTTDGQIICLDQQCLWDIDFGIIRCVGNPADRFNEDALRMLRAVRFSAQLNFMIDRSTFEAIQANAELITSVSAERIRDELEKLIMSDNPGQLELVYLAGLSRYIFKTDELDLLNEIINCPQHNKYHYTDVFHHTVDVIRNVPKDRQLRWAALFHDVGKPLCVTTDDDGWEHYYKHPEESATLFLKFAEKYKFDNETKDTVYTLILNHDREVKTPRAIRRLLHEFGSEWFIKFLQLRKADMLAHKFYIEQDYISQYSDLIQLYQKVSEEQPAVAVSELPISGNDLLALGIPQGPEIGRLLRATMELVLTYPEYNQLALLLEFVDLVKNNTVEAAIKEFREKYSKNLVES